MRGLSGISIKGQIDQYFLCNTDFSSFKIGTYNDNSATENKSVI